MTSRKIHHDLHHRRFGYLPLFAATQAVPLSALAGNYGLLRTQIPFKERMMNPPIESLEMRTLFSSARLIDGILTVNGDAEVNDTILVRFDGADLIAIINGETRRRVDPDDVEGISIRGRSGNDSLRIQDNVEIPATVDGDSGNDGIIASNRVNSRLIGDGGDDLIDGRGVMIGGSGRDNFDGSNFKDFMYGGSGRDSLDGANGDDVLFGEDGKDTVEGGGDDDTLFGGDGDDRVEGGLDNDSIFGNAGVDSLFGDIGADELYGGGTNGDVINGNEGADVEDPNEFDDIDSLIDDLNEEADAFA